jgi:hypothetical protein
LKSFTVAGSRTVKGDVNLTGAALQLLDNDVFLLVIFRHNPPGDRFPCHIRICSGNRGVEVLEDFAKSAVLCNTEGQVGFDDPVCNELLEMVAIKVSNHLVGKLAVSRIGSIKDEMICNRLELPLCPPRPEFTGRIDNSMVVNEVIFSVTKILIDIRGWLDSIVLSDASRANPTVTDRDRALIGYCVLQ